MTCVWYKWILARKGPIYEVYRKISSIWNIDLKITYKNITIIKTLNVNNPSVNIDTSDGNVDTYNGNTINIPVYISNFESEQNYEENTGIIINNTFLNVATLPLNFPMTDLIGEYQLSTNLKTETYNQRSVLCFVASCKVICKNPSPKVRNFENILLQRKNNIKEYTLLLIIGIY